MKNEEIPKIKRIYAVRIKDKEYGTIRVCITALLHLKVHLTSYKDYKNLKMTMNLAKNSLKKEPL
jgi:hypothetical protein